MYWTRNLTLDQSLLCGKVFILDAKFLTCSEQKPRTLPDSKRSQDINKVTEDQLVDCTFRELSIVRNCAKCLVAVSTKIRIHRKRCAVKSNDLSDITKCHGARIGEGSTTMRTTKHT